MSYKHRIEQALSRENWIIDEIACDREWWDHENWKVSFKYDATIFFYLCFIVDPMCERYDKAGQQIHEIKAMTQFPENWNDNTGTISTIQMSKRNFDVKLKEFIENLASFKNGNK